MLGANKKKSNRCSKKRFFYIKDIDSHYIIQLFCLLQIKIKHKPFFKYSEVNEYGLNNKERNPKVIVTLTSFPDRIPTLHKTITTLLKQTFKPDKLILWLADSQFPNKENDLTQELLNLKQYGLEIRWCEDLRSYKKLIPTLQEYPNDILVTADDDIYYPADWLESLYRTYEKNPNCIITRRFSEIFNENGNFKVTPINNPYEKYSLKSSYLYQQVGCGGCLYPPNSLHKDILDIEAIKTLIPTHDDIYFWAMSVLNHKKIAIVTDYNTNVECVEDTQQFGLCKKNKENGAGMNSAVAYERILAKYPECMKIIEEEENA